MNQATVSVFLLLLMSILTGCGSKDKKDVPPADDPKGGGGARQLPPEDEAKLKKAVADGDALYDVAVHSLKMA